MYSRLDPPPALLALASRQAGVLSSQQIADLGCSEQVLRRLVTAGSWRRTAHGIYATGPLDWTGQLWAGILLGGQQARIGGEAAGFLWGINPQPGPIVVMVPDSAPIRSRPPWVFRRERAGVRSPRSPGAPPRLTLPDTTIDLCEEASASEVVGIVTRAVGTRRTSASQLRSALESRTRFRHRRLALALLGDVEDGAQSWLEIHYLNEVERAHGLPRGSRQTPTRGQRFWRDVRYGPYGLVFELDGRIGHEGEGRFRDMRRDNIAVLEGETTLRYGYYDLTSGPCGVAFQVAAALTVRGWPGMLERCSLCAGVPLSDIA